MLARLVFALSGGLFCLVLIASCSSAPASATTPPGFCDPATENCVNPPTCPDGVEIPDGQVCLITCPDGSQQSSAEPCSPVQCADGTEVPNDQTCPLVQCADGTEVPGDRTCPSMQCLDGNAQVTGCDSQSRLQDQICRDDASCERIWGARAADYDTIRMYYRALFSAEVPESSLRILADNRTGGDMEALANAFSWNGDVGRYLDGQEEYSQTQLLAELRTDFSALRTDFNELKSMLDMNPDAAAAMDLPHRVIASGYSGEGLSALYLQSLDPQALDPQALEDITSQSLTIPIGNEAEDDGLADLPILFVVPAGAGGGKNPLLHQEYTERLDRLNYVIVVSTWSYDASSLTPDLDSNAAECGWAMDFCILVPWSIEYLTDPGNPEQISVREGTAAAVTWASVIVESIWTLWPNMTREEVRNLVFACTEDLGVPRVDEKTGRGRLTGECLFNESGVLRDPATLLPMANSLQSGALTLAGGRTSVQLVGRDRLGRSFVRGGLTASHLSAFSLRDSLPATGRLPGDGGSRALVVPHGDQASLVWRTGAIWGQMLPDLNLLGAQKRLSPQTIAWLAYGREKNSFAGSTGSGSWLLGDTDQLQAGIGWKHLLWGGWSLQTGLAVATFRHEPPQRSLLGEGRGDLAEAWARLYRHRTSLRLWMSSGLDGEIEVQRVSYAIEPEPSLNFSLGWAF